MADMIDADSVNLQKHKECSPSQVSKNENAVKKVMEVFQNLMNLFEVDDESKLYPIACGAAASDEVIQEVLSAKKEFITERLEKNERLFEPIKRQKSMDVDGDIDQNFLQRFSCMGTTDREVLVTEMQKLLGNQLNSVACTFFLDMNNWNLQAAVGSFYDFGNPSFKMPSMSFVKDITVGEGESVSPSTKFVKTWQVGNSGEEPWPPHCRLEFINGINFGHLNSIVIQEPVASKQTTDLSIEMISPSEPGIYESQWRMCTSSGYFFGDIIWVILTVSEAGLLGLTQQMSSFNELGSPPRNSAPNLANPFSSVYPRNTEVPRTTIADNILSSPIHSSESVINERTIDHNSSYENNHGDFPLLITSKNQDSSEDMMS
ncbi:hypothetical protein GQR58_015797 [Nymphon striatum]|nr:hypothetical protein GQR58_015797 [Nymphon striatum]